MTLIRALWRFAERIAQKLHRQPDVDLPHHRDGRRLAEALDAQRHTLQEKRRLLAMAISAIAEAGSMLRSGRAPAPSLYRRIIEVIDMQTNTDEWNKKYDALVQPKIAKLRALSPETLADLQRQWRALIEDLRSALGEDPAGERAQEFATRWVALLEIIMGGPIDRTMMGNAPCTSG